MTKAQPRPGKAGTGAVTAGSGQASGPAGPVTPARGGAVVDRVVPAHLACRIGARARGPCPAPVLRGAAGGPRGGAQPGAGKRVRQHHQTGLAPAAGRLAPGGGLTRPRAAASVPRRRQLPRLGRRGTRRRRCRAGLSRPPPRGSRPRPTGNGVLVIRVMAYAPGGGARTGHAPPPGGPMGLRHQPGTGRAGSPPGR